MKATGIVRRVDDLGRLVIPKELRRTLRIKEADPIEFYVQGDTIILKKYNAMGDLEQVIDNIESYIEQDDLLPAGVSLALRGKIAEMRKIIEKEAAQNEDYRP